MAQVPSFKRILREKFPSDLKWITFLLNPINSFMEDVTLAFNKRLNFRQNFDAEVKNITLNGIYPIKLAWNRANKPTIGLLGGLSKFDGSELTLSEAIFPIWKYNQEGEIVLTDVVGLSDSETNKYIITMVFLVE